MSLSPRFFQERVLVLGSGGQVGRSLLTLLQGHPSVLASVLGLSRSEADLSRVEEVLLHLENFRPTLVINAAAYTQVDRAETEQDLALAINGEAPGRLAEWCFQNGVLFVHYSTDYVFPGMGDQPWKENDSIGPLSFYGKSKRVGEETILKAASAAAVKQPRFLVFRTSWVYDSEGKNFLLTMLRLGKEKETLSVVSDQIGAPTYAPDLASATLLAIENALNDSSIPFPSGIYHLCGSGQTSWHEFATEIFHELRSSGVELKIKSVNKLLTADYPTPAKRPLNSRMSTDLAYSRLGVRLRDWRMALKECVETVTKGIRTS